MNDQDRIVNLEPCATCGRPHGGDYQPVHPFRSKGSPVVLKPSKDENGDGVVARPVRMPFDPVLRQALIDKGVLTVDDLHDAEAKIMAVTGVFQDAIAKGGQPFVHMTEVTDDDDARTPPATGWGRTGD